MPELSNICHWLRSSGLRGRVVNIYMHNKSQVNRSSYLAKWYSCVMLIIQGIRKVSLAIASVESSFSTAPSILIDENT